MLLTEIDHISIAVCDLSCAANLYEEAFGATTEHRGIVERVGIEEVPLKVAECYIRLLTPTRPDSPLAKAIEKRGEGSHHVSYRVVDCKATLESSRLAGAIPFDNEPRSGSRGTLVAFLHPKGSFGTLIELLEETSRSEDYIKRNSRKDS